MPPILERELATDVDDPDPALRRVVADVLRYRVTPGTFVEVRSGWPGLGRFGAFTATLEVD